MAALGVPYWVSKRSSDPSQFLDVLARYYASADNGDTIATNFRTENLSVFATGNDSTTYCGAEFDANGVITLRLTNSASAALTGKGVFVQVIGIAKNNNAGTTPGNQPI
jgi:hypothetical protein